MPSPSLNDFPGFSRKLIVGVGGLVVSNNQSMTLTTYSLGSCLGVTIYDPVVRAGGLLHVMLPDSEINPQKAAEQPGMFVDTGIPALFRAAYELRAQKNRVHICVAGGARFLDESGFFNIGPRNYESLTQLLKKHGLAIMAQAVGGLVSRSIHLDLATGEVRLRVSGQTEETVLIRP